MPFLPGKEKYQRVVDVPLDINNIKTGKERKRIKVWNKKDLLGAKTFQRMKKAALPMSFRFNPVCFLYVEKCSG